MSETDWRGEFRRLLPLYGHRNWIVIADSAFPAQVGAVEVVSTGADHLEVVREVLEAVRTAPHLRPVVRLDAELEWVADDLCPGASETREALDALVRDLSPEPALHAELLERIGRVAQSYRVLALKTTGVVPYSSVFLELDCGYWSPEQEARMRERMAG